MNSPSGDFWMVSLDSAPALTNMVMMMITPVFPVQKRNAKKVIPQKVRDLDEVV